ncbi:uncharacterized protein SCODWIG_03703 [Saccharomycodes ludwigii]|uniref:Uncharacterized protein n=1 Tax=Saccharomycodes ludwigii TaxID=36035 RepID=A0A376BB87_9ASCO|nr:uncharacterized protein SCODWIG_03703 [Saccharomycodes ludwigii]
MISQQQQPLHNNTINKNINTINNNNNNNNNTNGSASNGTNSNAYSSNGLSLQNINNFITGHTTLNSINNNTAGIINQPLSAQPTNMSNYSNTIPMSLNNNNSTTSTTNTTATQNMNNNMNANNPTRNLERFYAPLPSTTNMPLPPQHLDFNDPDILEIYSQLLIFKDREKYYGELAYPQGLTANHKRVINVICSFLCLYEVYDPEFIIIRRSEQPQQPLWFNSHFMLTQQQNQQQNQHQQQQQQQQQQVNSSTGFSLQPSLQPNSTGGSISKSHSYTSLLQAQHYAAAANTSMGATSLYQDSNSPPQIYQTISNIPNVNMDIINKLQRPPSANANIVSGTTSSIINPSMMQPGRIPSNTANSNNILLNNNLNSSSLTNSPNTITVATSNTNTLSNPLLRNHKATPPSMHTMPVTPSMSRTPFYPVNNSSQQQQTQQGNANGITNTPSQLLPQNTNGSVHSTYSTQSYYEPSGNSLYTSLSMSNLLGSQAMGHSNSFQQILNNITSSTPANDYPTTGVNVMSSSAGLQSSSMQFTAGHSIGGHINNSNNTLSNANDKINDNDTNDDNDNDDDDDDYDDDDDDDDDDNGNDTNIEFDMTKGLSGLEL